MTDWKLVPVDLTHAMLDATCCDEADDQQMRDTWKALLHAAPAHPPQPDALAKGESEALDPLYNIFELHEARKEGYRTAMEMARSSSPPELVKRLLTLKRMSSSIYGPLIDQTCATLQSHTTPDTDYQADVNNWLAETFGQEIADDKTERNHRFLEESNELAHAAGCTASEAHQIVDWVFSHPKGEVAGEIGDVMNTLAALATAHDIDMMTAAKTKMVECWAKIERTRAKHAGKPKFMPTPDTEADRLRDAEGIYRAGFMAGYRFIEGSRAPDPNPREVRRAWECYKDAALTTKDAE
ncbi:hypothetical protein [Sphingobium sp. BS19]|uniref:hypothetical protein n=1 Tax=Sphingobium sp. BS19 TaxID=3018973 RepID=UPI0022EF2DB8|nr:hypothetical protein [Sphingobium sp. BS19]GLI99103.1 hypothetical protein Sbs19_29210 [Sphingobium sp. BS19]